MSGILQTFMMFSGVAAPPPGGTAVADSAQNSDANAPSSSFTLTALPSGSLVILGYTREGSDVNLSVTSSGWTEIADLFASNTASTNFGVSYQYFAGSGDVAVTLSHSCKWVALVITGADSGDLFSTVAVSAIGENTSRPTPEAISAPSASLIVTLVASNNGGGNSRSLTENDGAGFTAPNSQFEVGMAVSVAVYDNSFSDYFFSQWNSSAEVQADCSWGAVTMAIK